MCSAGAGISPDIHSFHGALSADISSLEANPNLQMLAGRTPAAGLAVVVPQLSAALSAAQRLPPLSGSLSPAATGQEEQQADPVNIPTDLNSALAAYAAAAQQILACIQSLVHLQLCAWHWIKACKDYAHIGAPFKHLPMRGKGTPLQCSLSDECGY